MSRLWLSIDRLEPKQFSFNSPAGACSACDGLGMENNFDPERLIVDPLLSMRRRHCWMG